LYGRLALPALRSEVAGVSDTAELDDGTALDSDMLSDDTESDRLGLASFMVGSARIKGVISKAEPLM
jgi:hypothetical protein